MPTTIDLESQQMLLGSTAARRSIKARTYLSANQSCLRMVSRACGTTLDLSTLFQDAAGTIPVTSVDNCRALLDAERSRNHASQPDDGPPDSARASTTCSLRRKTLGTLIGPRRSKAQSIMEQVQALMDR